MSQFIFPATKATAAAVQAEAEALEKRANELEVAEPSVPLAAVPAAKEANRREAKRLREEAQALAARAYNLGFYNSMEAQAAAHSGRIVHQKFSKLPSKSRDEKSLYCEERRITRLLFEDGTEKFVLVGIRYKVLARKEREFAKNGSMCSYYDIYIPTGELGPPEPQWVTDSLLQMTDEELAAILTANSSS